MGLLLFLFFCIFASLLIAVAVGFSVLESRRKQQVASVLRTVTGSAESEAAVVLLKRPDEHNALSRLLHSLDIARGLQTRISQAGLDWNLASFVGMTAIAAAAGGFIGCLFHPLMYRTLSAIVFGGVAALLPYAFVNRARKKRFSEFEEQFPEALDFLARSMRAGHAFSVSLEMLGEESADPLGREFRSLFNEQNLGATIDSALANLARRVPLLDVRFFVSAVMLQRQTGGNLGEILTRLAFVIRERFRLRGQVRAASAHGRITATILTLMPIFLCLALMVISPDYLKILVKDPDGKYLIFAAIVAQLLGYYFIRRIVNIKV